MNQTQTKTKHLVTATVESRHNKFKKTLNFLTVDTITDLVPDEQLQRRELNLPKNIKLADPGFDQPAGIDLLLGSGSTLATLCIGQIRLSSPDEEDLILQKTHLGWIIGGSAPSGNSSRTQHCHVTKLETIMNKFWELERIPPSASETYQDSDCEAPFKTHIRRESQGRYVVALPFTANKSKLGESRSMALRRLQSLERRLEKDLRLKQEYTRILKEYMSLGHMTKVEVSDRSTPGYYLPHHPVMKHDSMTTKVRVVFDGSAKTTTGVSLNEVLMVGPTIQDNIFSLMVRFRTHRYVLTADVEKMYRQFKVRAEDRVYQRILWRDQDGAVTTYQLNTVTFGLASAPFLAIRCLKQLAEDEAADFPLASKILCRDLYVDDLLTGAATLQEARQIRDNLIELLERGGLNLRQWASNDARLLHGLSSEIINVRLHARQDNTIKTLGTHWNSERDALVYTVQEYPKDSRVTKRNILSHIARIYDPLGLLGPVITYAKLIMQQLWAESLDWDESLPVALHTQWIAFTSQLNLLHNWTVRRAVLTPDASGVQLHGFCDASERAYGACIYARSTDRRGYTKVTLLCAKSRIAPQHSKLHSGKELASDADNLTIPRLELCGAALLATLYNTVRTSWNGILEKTVFWCDNIAVLSWIRMPAVKFTSFIANRVALIQRETDATNWRHVRSNHNPADAISRGQLPSAFVANERWTSGPQWLTEDESTWPHFVIQPRADLPGLRKVKCFVTQNQGDLLEKYSSFLRLVRIVSLLLRFRKPYQETGAPSLEELSAARNRILRLMQGQEFHQELKELTLGRGVHRGSKVLSLAPFVDKSGLLRVGGRLKCAKTSFNAKHPILLPKSHYITRLIIKEEHERQHHAGAQTTLYSLRQTYWIVDGRNQTRRVIRECLKCARANPGAAEYIMGNLPAVRITPARLFQNVGIDFCGPFYIKEKKERNRNRVKVYVAIFICLVVKAVHLELVSDMSTEAFIAALKRFIARRGKCESIFSDNGSNFIGANNELRDIQTHLQSNDSKHYCANAEIKWHFIPPQSPNFGGLWEAAVKSFKHHMKRVVGEQLLTFEQLYTFVTEVEAILNSRPLTVLSTDPNDPPVLSPGHFLIGNSLTSCPEPNLGGVQTNRLSLWQHIVKMKQDFWTRWSKEYLNGLNVRQRWQRGDHNIKQGSMVLLREQHRPPLSWPMGRVIETMPGTDGIIRIVRVKTSTGVMERNVRQLALLPIAVED